MLRYAVVLLITCSAHAQELLSIEILGPRVVGKGLDTQFECIAHFGIGDVAITPSADWSVEPNDLASIDAGLLSVDQFPGDQVFTISASYTLGEQTEHASIDVNAADVVTVPSEYPTIQGAVDAALDGSLLLVDEGYYFEKIQIIDKSLTIRGIGTAFISGEDDGRTLLCQSSSHDVVTLESVWITDGYVNQPNSPGAGIRAVNVDLNLVACRIFDNVAEHETTEDEWPVRGGGVAIENGALTIDQCLFINNQSDSLYLYDYFLTQCSLASGGAIYANNADVLITDSEFLENACPCPADGSGGAIRHEGGTLTVIGCEFVSNLARGGHGGAISAVDTVVEVSDCTFEGNSSIGGLPPMDSPCDWGPTIGVGGAIALDNCDAQLDNLSCANNEAAQGGAISSSGTLTVTSSRFAHNQAVGMREGKCHACPTYFGWIYRKGDGGAIVSFGEFEAVNTTFLDNYANARGGALYISEGTIVNSLFVGNTADSIEYPSDSCNEYVRGEGGAIFGQVTCVNTIFSGNQGSARGGAIWGHATLTNCTLSGNIGGENTLVSNGSIINSVAWGNVGTGFEGEAVYSIMEGGHDGTGVIDEDPIFADPPGEDGIIGTEDDDLRVTRGSPAIDAASNDLLPNDEFDLDGDGNVEEPLPVDLDWSVRRVEDPFVEDTGRGRAPIVDMGAYERQPACRADVNNDLRLNVLDFVAFQLLWQDQDPAADCDANGTFNSLDFACYQIRFHEGCD